jgi:hypothetical protein
VVWASLPVAITATFWFWPRHGESRTRHEREVRP